MEPQFMIAGQAAGTAAAIAAKSSGPVHNVPINELQEKLRTEGQILQAP
jgi:phosphoribosylcarboxyaminoimidazole (NCAIR) mutase